MLSTRPEDTLDEDYDEFAFLEDVAAEWSIPWRDRPAVERRTAEIANGQKVSYLAWGDGEPELVFLHGGGQNAHTWDAVNLALGRPAIAVDLPGHGHSDWRADKDYTPWVNAETLGEILPEIAPDAAAVVGMSLGGATTIALAASRPDLARTAVIVDVTPQVNDPNRTMSLMDRGTVALIGGAPSYDSFEAMAEAAVALSPHRPADSVRRGVRHNAMKTQEGAWAWRYDLFGGPRPSNDFTRLWPEVDRIQQPAMLVLGGLSKYVLPQDVEEMVRRKPDLQVESVAGAGHAVQSDQPLELIRLIEEFAFGHPGLDNVSRPPHS
jgi:pimeloyl-ACP methyl ester carboxylesterase